MDDNGDRFVVPVRVLLFSFIHPSIIFHLSEVKLWMQQVKQRIQEIFLPSHVPQFLLGDPKAFPGLIRSPVT